MSVHPLRVRVALAGVVLSSLSFGCGGPDRNAPPAQSPSRTTTTTSYYYETHFPDDMAMKSVSSPGGSAQPSSKKADAQPTASP